MEKDNMTVMESTTHAYFDCDGKDRHDYVGLMRGDFGTSGNHLYTSWFPGPYLESFVDNYGKEELKELDKEINYILSIYNTYDSIENGCKPDSLSTDSHNNVFFKGDKVNYWVRLNEGRGDYNIYIKLFAKEVTNNEL